MCAIHGSHTAVWSAIIQGFIQSCTHAGEDALYEGDLLELRPTIMLVMFL